MATSAPLEARRPHRTTRIRYKEDSDDDFDYQPSSRTDRPSRSMRQPTSYRELSEDSEPERIFHSRSESESSRPSTRSQNISQSVARQRKRRPLTRKYATRNKTKEPTFSLFKKRKANPVAVDNLEKAIRFPLGPSGRSPPWQTLPYEALLIIMRHAAYPLYGVASRATSSIEWLCNVSLLSRSFHGAAVAVLLYSPPLYPVWRAQGLIELLRRDQTKTIINFHNKIKRLDIEVKNLLITKNGVSLEEIIQYTPNLEHLRLYHNHDDLSSFVWAQPSASKTRKWAYPDALFDKLDATNVRLKSFEWNGRFPTPHDVLEIMARVHTRACFSSIDTLNILNVEFPEKYPEEDLTVARNLLSTSLSALPNLRSLTFRNCNLLDEVTTPLLPHSLTSLDITNNLTFLSGHLAPYLANRGSLLTSLTLKHNQSMSLDFLSSLAAFTPRLQHLNLDLSYTDPSSYKDLNPLYDDALPDGPPTWPSSLVSIDIENLRQISSMEVEAFLDSLVRSAPDLRSLRRISLKAIIRDAGWRERAALRTKWIPKIDQIFLDTSVPRPIRSLPPAQVQPLEVSSESNTEDSGANMKGKGKDKGRRSGRLREAHIRRLTAEQERTLSEAEAADLIPVSKSRNSGVDGCEVRQGRCNTVMLDISDQRPAELQYREADFMDDEPSDDEDYRER